MEPAAPLPSMAFVEPIDFDGVMVFDGVCNLCSGYVRFVTAVDRQGLIRFAAMQSPLGRSLCEANGVDPFDPATFLFFDQGRALEGTDAIAAMLARLPRPWRWLRFLVVIPRPLRDGVYRWTARNRYRLLGKRHTCMIPRPAIRARFLEAAPPAE
jgi:predicted DCC family thiol-disulfide oxidoreductase YuxK